MTLQPHGIGGPPLDRRGFLKGSMLLALAAGSPALLAACGKRTPSAQGSAGPSSTGLALSRPDSPATLPLFDDNPAIAAGLEPESGGTFKIFNYTEYNGPDVLKAFGKKYGVKVEVTTFDSMDDAVTKLRTAGTPPFDVFFPTPDVMSKIVAGKLIQPLNHSYITGLTNVWDQLQDPFYDQGSQYTVPYTVYTTGIGYRADRVQPGASATGGYDMLWDPKNKGKAVVIDDYREAPSMVMLKDKLTADINTEDKAIVDAAEAKLAELIDLVNIKYGIAAYTAVPEGSANVYQCWSGDMINAQYYLPKGVGPEVLGYWYPTDEPGVIGSDCIAIPKSAEKPVLAHLFLDYMLQPENAVANFGYTGYQPPQKSLDPSSLVKDEYVAENIASTVVRPEDYADAQQILQISAAGEAVWRDAWARFKAGA